MATRRYGINPGANYKTVVETTGSACSSGFINLVIDLGSDVTGAGNVARVMKHEEVILALEQIKAYIMTNGHKKWPPA